jgi:hypothetical protein
MSLLSKRQKTQGNSFIVQYIYKFKFRGGGGGEGGVRGGVEKKEKKLKEQIDVNVSTKFQINPSTNG